jgi:dephospho-CoA kinase
MVASGMRIARVELRKVFGQQRCDQTINRKCTAALEYENPTNHQQINRICHARIRHSISERRQNYRYCDIARSQSY